VRRDIVFYMPTATPLVARDGPGAAGGAEIQVLLLGRELARRGYRVGMVVFDDAGPLLPRVDGVDVIAQSLPATRLPVVRTLLYWLRTLALLRRTPARVYVQRAAGIHTALVAACARLLRRRFVYASAGLHDFDLGTWQPRRWIVAAFGLAVRAADAVVVQSEEQARLCRARFGHEPVVIPSIAEEAQAEAEPAAPEAFLWLGRPIDHKRPLAYVALARAVPEARFLMVVVGDSEPVRRAAAGVPNLELLAPRPRAELGRLLDRAVAVVSTSVSEGMPNAFLEGWSRGAPALALDHDPDGVLERAGVGACAHGSPERLAALARELWAGRGQRERLARRCRDHVAAHHAAAVVADRWIDVLGLA
jgi:glycosyltransferase involved in cell wall biosynthesis